MADQNNAPELPDRIWLDERTFNGAVGFAHSKQHHPGAWAEYIRADRAAPEGQGYFGPMGIPHWSRALTPPPAAPTDNTTLVEELWEADGRLDELGFFASSFTRQAVRNAATALASREAPPAAQEPVAWMLRDTEDVICAFTTKLASYDAANWIPLYAAPPPACQQEAVTEAEALLQRAVDLIKGDLTGSEWKRACNAFVKDALRALKGGEA